LLGCVKLAAVTWCGHGFAMETDRLCTLWALILVLYAIIPTFQSAHFGRVYAAYGGMFIVLSLLWGWGFDGTRPDRFDAIGCLICLIGMTVIMYVPRT
jgi:small multidrug resistance family-3 protein